MLALVLFAPQNARAQGSASSSVKPTAQTAQERDDYRAAAKATGGAAMLQSARGFAKQYPKSTLRLYLYQRALRQYQVENDADGIRATVIEVLAIDPGDPQALVLSAMSSADELPPSGPDRDRKVSDIKHSVDLALHNLDHGALPASVARDQAALYRSTLQHMAYSALGIMKLKTGDDAGAEKDLKTAAGLSTAHPDPSVWYHLALAQDHRKRYSAAINSVEQAMQLASSNPQLQRLAQLEHERLYRLTGRTSASTEPGSSPPPQ
jgi:tetratricopeptide (TPR) repeat protein